MMIRSVVLLLLMTGAVEAADRPRLYIVHSDACLGCVMFDRLYCSDPEFRAALQNAYDLRSLDWDIPDQRAKALALGIDQLPGFSAWRGQRNLRTFEGFTNSKQGVQHFMNLLNIEWPRQSAPAPPKEQPVKPPVRAPDPVPSPADLEDVVRKQLQDFSSKSEAERKQLLDALAKLQNQVATPAEQPAAEAPAEQSPTAAKWLSVASWIGKTAITVAAPEIALPASAGLTVLGGLVTWSRRRRAQRAASAPKLGSQANPINVIEPAQVRTETKYVRHETDMLGEAYKEGIRRVGNAYRENRPDIIEILKQVDAAADQIFHGQRVVKRPQTAQVSENQP